MIEGGPSLPFPYQKLNKSKTRLTWANLTLLPIMKDSCPIMKDSCPIMKDSCPIISLKSQLEELLERSEMFNNRSGGFSKYQTAIKGEIAFLDRISASKNNVKWNKGSNYHYLNGIMQVLEQFGGGEVYKLFKYYGKETIRVDVCVANCWIQVKARQRYLCDDLDDEEDEEDENMDPQNGYCNKLAVPDHKLVQQARRLMEACKKTHIHFNMPRVIFQFLRLEPNGISKAVLAQLNELGVQVQIIGTDNPLVLDYGPSTDVFSTSILNLDIPTLVAMVSSITHDFSSIPVAAFESTPLKLQYKAELSSPILPKLLDMLNGKKLVCSMDAFEKFKPIIETIGGPREIKRANLIFSSSKQVQSKLDHLELCHPQPNLDHLDNDVIVNDLPWIVQVIPNSNQTKIYSTWMSEHNLNVFGTGMSLKLTTCTANAKLSRYLERSSFGGKCVLLHEPRGLIEQKWIKHSQSIL